MIATLILFWLASILLLILIFKNLLRLLCGAAWSALGNIPHALEENVCSAVLGWSVLGVFVGSGWFTESLKSSLTDHLSVVLSVIDYGLMKPPTIIIDSPILSVFASYTLEACCLTIYSCNCCLLDELTLYSIYCLL